MPSSAPPDLLPDRLPGLPRWLVRPAARALRTAFGLEDCRTLVQQAGDGATLLAQARAVLQQLDVTVAASGRGLASALPGAGPVIVIANHPFGALDALAMATLLEPLRADFRYLGNRYWEHLPVLAPKLVSSRARRDAVDVHANAVSVRALIRWLRAGHALALFPARHVAHWSWSRMAVAEVPWSNLVGILVAASGASVVPCHIHGANPAGFQVASALCPPLRHALLMRALLAGRHGRVRVTIGAPVVRSEFPRSADAGSMTRALRGRVFALGRELAAPYST